MDSISDWIADRQHKIPIGRWGREFFDFLTRDTA
jgi:glycine betaine/proline transport system permease protein